MRLGNTRLVAVAVVAAGIVAVAAGDAFARSRGGWGSHGSYGSAGSYSGGSYGGSYASYYSGGSYGGSYASSGSYSSGSYGGGSHGRTGLFSRWHARKAAKHSYGSYGGYASSGSSGSYGSYGSYSSSGSSGSYGGTIYESYPAEVEVTDPSVVPSAPAVPSEATPPAAPSASATEATIFVSLPADAKVFVNDLATTSTGAERHYVSRGLKPGSSYSYKLRVQFERDGKPVTEDKVVRLTAGENIQLAFGGAAASDATAQTELKLSVPANAKVTLAGAPTEQTGDVRTYTTDSLAPGQKWNGYTVRVELEENGKTLVEEKTLDIEGGKSYELAFELAGDSLKVAAN
jgi:uncharacterized protein (TIGR03000 family)